jgi:hypothetical protein
MKPLVYVTLAVIVLRTSLVAQDRGMHAVTTEQVNAAKTALVLGNAAYENAPLRNSVNDARAIAQSLKSVGFDVRTGENLKQNDMKRMIWDFGKRIKAGGVALFYYSGHGIQVSERNYLVPIGARIEQEPDVELEAIDVGRVMAEMMKAENSLNIVILDACRNNPYARSFRSSVSGLAQMKAPTGTIVAYSTEPGSVASDGDEDLGLYTGELVNALNKPGLKVEDVFKRVRAEVLKKSQNKQTPWESSSLTGDFYFNNPIVVNEPSPAVTVKKEEPMQGESVLTADYERKARETENALATMQKDFDAVKSLEEKDISVGDKVDAWKKFLNVYAKDMPATDKDDGLRDNATRHIAQLQRGFSMTGGAIILGGGYGIVTKRSLSNSEYTYSSTGTATFRLGYVPVDNIMVGIYYCSSYEMRQSDYYYYGNIVRLSREGLNGFYTFFSRSWCNVYIGIDLCYESGDVDITGNSRFFVGGQAGAYLYVYKGLAFQIQAGYGSTLVTGGLAYDFSR